MLESGMTVARFNMSHGDHDEHATAIATARRASKNSRRPLAILQDLSGPKIRIGDLATQQVLLEEGFEFILTTKKCVGTADRVHVNYKKLPKEVHKGCYIYLNDGKIQLQVNTVTKTEVYTTIIVGGFIRGRRGVNVPDAKLSIATITAKDKRDIAFGVKNRVDIITLSFVRSASDITRLRKILTDTPSIMIAAKIETKAAVDNLDEILKVADALMVARGDLAIEVPPEKVPGLQKRIIRAANRAGKPVITATQMLDSMRLSTVPTRAEVNDVANAILDGSDAVMLSDETAIGEHPIFAVKVMARIAKEIESQPDFAEHMHVWDTPIHTRADAVSRAIARTALATDAKAIVAFSESGYTGRMVARYRPRIPILVLTPNKETFNKSLLTYGCDPVLVSRVRGLNQSRRVSKRALLKHGAAEKGDIYILGAGIPFGKPGSTNLMLVERV
jgi:pyruvate kinase